MGICKEFDAYVHNSMIDGLMTLWIVELDNGETVYLDDNRPGETEWNAWIRLKEYVDTNNLKVSKMKLKYKSNEINLPENAEAYFFKHGAKALITNEFANRVSCYLTGVKRPDSNEFDITWWRVPELTAEETEVREIDLNDVSVINNNRNG